MELVFNNIGGKITSGGYTINDRNIVSSMFSGGGKKDDSLYVMPVGLVYVETKETPTYNIDIEYIPDNVVSDEIYNALYNSTIVEIDNGKNKSPKNKSPKNNKKSKKKNNKSKKNKK